MDILSDLLIREGGYVAHASDKGGPTRYGITIGTLSRYRGTSCSAEDVQNLTEAEARQIYERDYITGPGFDKIKPARTQALVIDIGVMSGPAKATKLLQRALNVPDDGVLGPQTLGAMNNQDITAADITYRRLIAHRMRDLGKIISGDPSQAPFAAGWLGRLADFLV